MQENKSFCSSVQKWQEGENSIEKESSRYENSDEDSEEVTEII